MERDPLSVIDILYEGALDEDAWRRGLLAVADLVSASGLFLLSCNPRTCEVYRYELPRLDPRALEHYQAYWVAQDPRYAGGLARPPGEAQTDDMLVPRAEMRRTDIYNEFLRPNDFPFCIASWVIRTATHGVAMCIQGSRSHGPFDEDEQRKIAVLLPHLKRVIRIKDRLTRASTSASLLLESMDRMPFGVLVLADDLSILEASAMTRQILAVGDGLMDCNGQLGFRRSTDAQQFARVLTADGSGVRHDEGVVTVRRLLRPGHLTLLSMPLAPGQESWLRPRARHLVLIFDSDHLQQPSTAALQRSLGLSAAEAELSALLAQGLSLADAATRRGLSIHTVRSQLKVIFGKTGASSQAQLVRMVLTGPASVSGVDTAKL